MNKKIIKAKVEIVAQEEITNKIYLIRGQRVMLDRDLAELYGVKTHRLNEQVKRNKQKFPDYYKFQLTKEEKEELIANCDNLKFLKFSPSFPYVFTEYGVSQVASILNSNIAIEMSIKIIDAFIAMKKFLSSKEGLYRLDNLEQKQLEHDRNFAKVFNAIDKLSNIKQPKQGVFFNGHIFDAYVFVKDLIASANKDLIIIDNYIDDTVITLLSHKEKQVAVSIITKDISRKTKLAINKFSEQYGKLLVTKTDVFHCRFMFRDIKKMYHI